MIDVENIRKDFPMLNKKREKPLVYFDNAATTLKPSCVLDEISKYYEEYTANAHRGDYDLSYIVDTKYEGARKIVADFINANKNEVVFTSGTTESLNLVAYGWALEHLKENDEILISELEHASNVLPWYKISKITGAKVKFIPLVNSRITLEEIKKSVTDKTKLISITQASNFLGYTCDVKAICEYAHSNGILVSVDAAQSATFMRIDVKELDCDFLSMSAHKLCGPTGVGALYIKKSVMDVMGTFQTGGGMNISFDVNQNVEYKSGPSRFEAGTPKIEGALGFAAAINYLMSHNIEELHKREIELKNYALQELSKLDNIEIYNKDGDAAIISFNIKGVPAQDGASYFNKYGIALRAGNHCAKLVTSSLKYPFALRCSLSFYNTKEEIDYFVSIAKGGSDFLDAYF